MRQMLRAALVFAAMLLIVPMAEAALTGYSATVLADGPVMYWSFDETGTANAIEQVGMLTANELVATGGATRASHASLGSELLLGNAADLRGGSDYFAAADLFPTTTLPGAYAIELWMATSSPATPSEQAYCVNFHSGAVDNHPAVLYDWKSPANEVELFGANGGRTSGGPIINDTKWHHFLFVVYGDGTFGVANRVDAFLNGNLLGTVTGTFSQKLDVSQSLTVGSAHLGLQPLRGLIDELALYDLSGLSLGQVEAKAGDLAQHFQLVVPEPSSVVLIVGALGLLFPILGKRKLI